MLFCTEICGIGQKKKRVLSVFWPPVNSCAYQQLSFISDNVVRTKHISLSQLLISLYFGGLLSWEPKSPFV